MVFVERFLHVCLTTGYSITTAKYVCVICPMCSSVVKSFFVNYNEKTVICENLDCAYPFMMDMIYVKEDNELATSEEVASYRSRPSGWSQGTVSIMSAAEWSDIDKLNQTFEADENFLSQHNPKKLSHADNAALENRVKIKENEEQIRENVEKIKQLNKRLFGGNNDHDCIRNEKWIKNFYRIQETKGVQLLKQQELAKLKLDEEEASREVQIHIDPGTSIHIEIKDKNDNNEPMEVDGNNTSEVST
ncbi:uncharacterized protein LOC113505880 isoform X2 [Trichoplusia ni]|uniref:Uncharacterized protein LOC113505880 isoform X2 n=1 Tax=Trichoplusia ni TaxID=7111 RepID=A0A7E5WUL5_TRINI|nr:uncharacterized protein LOC113505880 isoform X2 [Trichoplusia ni]